jgi:hypothetical protein
MGFVKFIYIVEVSSTSLIVRSQEEPEEEVVTENTGSQPTIRQ